MRTELNKITITLENYEEVRTFWNVVMFALDFDSDAKKSTGSSRMTPDERRMAEKLAQLTEDHFE